MGMYTELIFGCSLKEDTPHEVIETLRYMTGTIQTEPDNLVFRSTRNPLRGGSYYFGVTKSVSEMTFLDISKQWQISTRANIKNYNNSIEKFLEWIKPYIETGSGSKDMYAIVIYEEADKPSIYYLN